MCLEGLGSKEKLGRKPNHKEPKGVREADRKKLSSVSVVVDQACPRQPPNCHWVLDAKTEGTWSHPSLSSSACRVRERRSSASVQDGSSAPLGLWST